MEFYQANATGLLSHAFCSVNGIDSNNREDELCETDTFANHTRAAGFLQGRWYHTKTVGCCKSVMTMIFCRIDVFCSLYYIYIHIFFIIGVLAHCAANYSFFVLLWT